MRRQLLKPTVELPEMSTCVNRPVKKMTRAIVNAYVFVLCMLPTVVLADEIFLFAGHTYKIVTSPATWSAASTNAKKMRVGKHHGYLVRIDSKRENRSIFDAVKSHLSKSQLANTTADDGSGAPFIWLGGSDSARRRMAWENNDDQFWSGDFNGSAVAGRYTNGAFNQTAPQARRTHWPWAWRIGQSPSMTLEQPVNGTTSMSEINSYMSSNFDGKPIFAFRLKSRF